MLGVVAAALAFTAPVSPAGASVRTSSPSMGMNSRRDALLGLAAASVAGMPAIAEASKVPSVFDVRKGAQYNGPQVQARTASVQRARHRAAILEGAAQPMLRHTLAG